MNEVGPAGICRVVKKPLNSTVLLLTSIALVAQACGTSVADPTEGTPVDASAVNPDAPDGESTSMEASARSDANAVLREASTDGASSSTWEAVAFLGTELEGTPRRLHAIADLSVPERLYVLGEIAIPASGNYALHGVMLDGNRVSLKARLSTVSSLEGFAVSSGPVAISSASSGGGAAFSYHSVDGTLWTSLPLGSSDVRPPQATFGSWPPRSLIASRTKVYAVTSADIRDITRIEDSAWPTFAFRGTSKGASDEAYSAVALDAPGGDERVALISLFTHTSRKCTLSEPLTCSPTVDVTGLPATSKDVDGYWSSGNEAYLSLRAPSGQRDLYVSHDGSASFVLAQSSFPDARYASTHPSHGERFAYVVTSEVRLTVDSGRTWRSLALPDAASGRSATVALDADGWLYLVQGGTAYRTKAGP